MKTRISLLAIAFACVSLAASSAFAEVQKSKLLGTWSGQITADVHGQKKSVSVEMTFKGDGTVTVKEGKSGKTDKANYVIKDDSIVLSETGKSQKITLANIKLTDDTFSGDFVPQEDENNPPLSVYITFSMKRGK